MNIIEGINRLRERHGEILVLFLILVLILIMIGGATGGEFLKIGFLQSMAFQLPMLGLLALAQMGPMLTGGIDLSVISIANLSGIVAAIVLTGMNGPTAILLAVVAAMLTAIAAGSLNGIIISVFGVSPIIGTLGMMIFLRGVALIVTKGDIIAGFPQSFLYLGNGTILGIPVPLIIFGAIIAIFAVIVSKTPYGVSAYMVGSNETATRFSGVNTKWVLFRTYLTSGFLAGITAFIMITRYNSAQAGAGFSYLLLTVLICVLGGISPDGGIGKVTGLFLAIIILQFISSGFNLMGLSSHLASALWGIILIFALFLNKLVLAQSGAR
ncbi:ABC transporter permease [Candidatus Bipolaricaulota bacterium]|nr:ABC transporter permease [Candidatus Bipolaricaulota bacterium]